MELKSLYTVKKIIETGSYLNASKALNYAQSTITFQVKQLEAELDVQIFEKRGNKMALTQEGERLIPLIDNVIAAAEELLTFKKQGKDMQGTLKVALPETLVTYQLQPVFKKFKELAPKVKLAIQVKNCFRVHEELLKGTIDIGIHYDVRKYPSNIEFHEFGTFPMALVASPELDEAERDFITPSQMKSVCHIQNDPNAPYLKMFNRYLENREITLASDLELWSIESIKQSVMSNLGVSLLPKFTVQKELDKDMLIELATEMPGNELTAIYAFNRNKWRSPAMELFMQILREYYGVE